MTKSSAKEKLVNCQLLACNCENTMTLDTKKLAADLGLEEQPEIYHNLCRSQLASFETAIAKDPPRDTIITCTQEAPLFLEVAGETSETEISLVNIRENAGWSKSGAKAGPKIAALIAESQHDITPTGLISIVSGGKCILYGAGQQALDIATKLAPHLDISLILSSDEDLIVPRLTQFSIHRGKISGASGSIGKFKLTLEHYGALKPSSKGQLEFYDYQHGITLDTDLIFDLSGGSALLGSKHGRDGYHHVEPNNPVKIAETMFDIIDLVGEFEKPLFVSYEPSICAHSRSGKTGCNKCIDNCPTSAITSSGEAIVVDNQICDGCGHCSAACPTGAIAYALPRRTDLIGRCQTLISTYLSAGGKNPIILLHEENHGGELISAMARFDDGLAQNVLPLSVHSITHIGHDIFTTIFTTGLQSILVLAPVKKRDEMQTLDFEIKLTNTFLRAMQFDENVKVQLLVEDDPQIVSQCLAKIANVAMPAPNNLVAANNKRDTAHLALANLNEMAPVSLDVLQLPHQSPYGQIAIDTDACTLCLACVGACPASALGDNEDRPQVSFNEHACVQCGLCQSTCPENAISLSPRYNFDKSAIVPVVLNHEEPFECIKCAKPFGSKSAIEKVIGILEGKNAMFQTSQQLDLIRMCDNCRVVTLAENQQDPMTLGTVPKTMTADDIFPEDEEPTKH